MGSLRVPRVGLGVSAETLVNCSHSHETDPYGKKNCRFPPSVSVEMS